MFSICFGPKVLYTASGLNILIGGMLDVSGISILRQQNKAREDTPTTPLHDSFGHGSFGESVPGGVCIPVPEFTGNM